jgi:hypothetical protein
MPTTKSVVRGMATTSMHASNTFNINLMTAPASMQRVKETYLS